MADVGIGEKGGLPWLGGRDVDDWLCMGAWMSGRRSWTAGFTVGFSEGSVVALLLGHVGDKVCSDGRLRSALAVPRSDVYGLALIMVVIGTPLGGVGEFPSESSVSPTPATMALVGVACFLETSSWVSFLC